MQREQVLAGWEFGATAAARKPFVSADGIGSAGPFDWVAEQRPGEYNRMAEKGVGAAGPGQQPVCAILQGRFVPIFLAGSRRFPLATLTLDAILSSLLRSRSAG